MALDEGLIVKLSASSGVDEATTQKVCNALANMLMEIPLFDFRGLLKVNEPVQFKGPIQSKFKVPVQSISPVVDDDDDEQWLKDNLGGITYLMDLHLPKEISSSAWTHFSAIGVHRTPTGELDVSALTKRLRKNIIL